MKYIVLIGLDDDKEFNNKDEAIERTLYIWEHLTSSEKDKYGAAGVLESENPDVEAWNHYDGDIVFSIGAEYLF